MLIFRRDRQKHSIRIELVSHLKLVGDLDDFEEDVDAGFYEAFVRRDVSEVGVDRIEGVLIEGIGGVAVDTLRQQFGGGVMDDVVSWRYFITKEDFHQVWVHGRLVQRLRRCC